MAIAATFGVAPVAVYGGKVSTDGWYLVFLSDTADEQTGITGVAFGSVDADYSVVDATGSLASYTVTTNDWKEIGEGLYGIRIGASEFSAAGRYVVRVGDTTPLANKFVFLVEVTAATLDDLVRSATPANTLSVNASGRVDVGSWLGTAVTLDATTSKPDVNVDSWQGQVATNDATTLKPDVNVDSWQGQVATNDATTLKPDVNVDSWQGIAATNSATTQKPQVDVVSYADAAAAKNGTSNLPMVDVDALDGSTAKATALNAAIDSAENLVHVDLKQINDDATGIVNMNNFFNGTGYAGGTVPLIVDVRYLFGDATAGQNLTDYCDGTTPMPVNAIQISGDAPAADNAELFFDNTGFNASNSTIGTATAVSGNVNLNLAQALSESPTNLTVGWALLFPAANDAHRVTVSGGIRTIYKSDAVTPLGTRTQTDTSLTP